jgi:hypothetical protein
MGCEFSNHTNLAEVDEALVLSTTLQMADVVLNRCWELVNYFRNQESPPLQGKRRSDDVTAEY